MKAKQQCGPPRPACPCYVRRPDGSCVWCDWPRSEHRTEWVPGTEGEKGKAVEIQQEAER